MVEFCENRFWSHWKSFSLNELLGGRSIYTSPTILFFNKNFKTNGENGTDATAVGGVAAGGKARVVHTSERRRSHDILKMHNGTDINGERGTKVVSTAMIMYNSETHRSRDIF